MEKIRHKDGYTFWYTVAPGVWRMKDLFVNIYMIHNPQDNTWVLVDTGLKTSAAKIKKMAEHLFWPELRPAGIVLTHGHFDHVGSLKQLAAEWEVPVYAHYMERPYLTGQSAYPPPDPTVGGGMMATMSWMYPRGPIDIGKHLSILPQDGTIPCLPEWKYIHTPGHAPGHISLFRERDRVLLAGDAFVTTRQESALCALTQAKRLSGPPKYFTYNWTSAAESVKKLAALEPEIVATGHGQPMKGAEMRRLLHNLADNFEKEAVPAHGRYVDDPAYVNADGVEDVPPPVTPVGLLLKIAGLAAAVALTWWLVKERKKKQLAGFSLN
ncbi:MAG TPA: MBL fold metallo-hydrolase [Chitinophagaceae bacterium]|nr:MBL fold metallo-hydrolase [Chitinophagaceae bacterium]